MEVAQNFRASCESYTDGKDRLKYWVDNISEVMTSCSVEHHAKLLNPLMCGEITIRDIVKVFSASFPCFEEKNPKLGERMMRALYQTGKCTNFAAFWAMWTRISWRLNRKGEASKICEQGFKMELDDESFLRRAQKLLMEEQGDRIEYALREQTKSRVLGSVENVTKENKEQTVALLKLNNIEANVNAVLQKVEKLETQSTRIYSFLEAFEERLGRIEATASRIEESKHVAFKSEDSVVKDRKNNVLINLANEFSGDQDSSFIQLMSNSKADFTPADPTEVSQTAILDANNLITFSPATDLENIPPPPCDKPERKSKVGFACKPFKASQGQSKENEQPKLIPHRAQESVGVDLNATELEAAITEYETEFKQRLENPVSVAQTRNLLNGTEIEAAITEYETKFQQKFQNLACASQASKNWLSDTFYVGVGTIADNQREVGSHSASVKPQSSEHNVIPSDDSLSHILQEESMSTGSQPELPTEKSSKQEMAVENVKAAALLSFEHLLVDVTKAEDIDTNLTAKLGDDVEYTRDLLPEENILPRKIVRDNLEPVTQAAPIPVPSNNLSHSSNPRCRGNMKSAISSVPGLSPISDEGSYQSSENSVSTTYAHSEVSSQSNLSHASSYYPNSPLASFCPQKLPMDQNSFVGGNLCSLSLKDSLLQTSYSLKTQLEEAIPKATKVDSYSINESEKRFLVLPESPADLGSVSQFDLVTSICESKTGKRRQKVVISNIYGECFIVNMETNMHENCINSVLKERLQNLNANFDFAHCFPSEIFLIRQPSSIGDYCSFINVSDFISFADLISKLNQSGSSLTEVQLALITVQLISILETVHKCHIILTSVDLESIWIKMSAQIDISRRDHFVLSDSHCTLLLTGIDTSIDVSAFQTSFPKFLIDDASVTSFSDSFGCLQAHKGQYLGHKMDLLGLGCCVAALISRNAAFQYDKNWHFLKCSQNVSQTLHNDLWLEFFSKTMEMNCGYNVGFLPTLREKFVDFLDKVSNEDYKESVDGLASLMHQ